MSIKKGHWGGGIRTLEDLKRRCTEDGDCWIWQGCLSSNGSPSIWLHGHTRVSGGGAVCFLTTGKPVAKGMNWVSVCRRLDCVNPEHRKEMTIAQMRKHSMCARTEAQKIAYAAIKQARSTLTHDDVRHIRSSDETLDKLAAKYGKSVSLMSKIRRGIVWKDNLWRQLA